MIKAAAATGRSVRWLLLFCTALGLAFMHTLGHAGVDGGHSRPPALQAVAGMPALAGVADCPDGHCDGHGGPSAWSVCLAILTGLGLVVLLAVLLLAVIRWHGLRAPALTGSAAVPRAPPYLALTSTVVLRI